MFILHIGFAAKACMTTYLKFEIMLIIVVLNFCSSVHVYV